MRLAPLVVATLLGCQGGSPAGPDGPDSASPLCREAGAACAAAGDCCSGQCDGVCLAGTCATGGAPCAAADDCCSGACVAHACAAVGVASTDDNRDRLLDTLAQRRGALDRCALWNETLDNVERGVFLTHTDMLGDRSCFANASITSGPLDSRSGCDASSNPCQCAPGSEMVLDHVFALWSVNGGDPGCTCDEGPDGYNCCNGGGDWHRTFFSADDLLIAALRRDASALPEWGPSGDLAGPHDPFTQSSETSQGTPRGQTHFFANDAEAVTLTRPGVDGVLDPHVVEIDNDYNILHDSNPEGCYGVFGFGCTYGRARFKTSWSTTGTQAATTFAGNGQPGPIDELAADTVYGPRCGPTVSGVVEAASGTADALRARALVRITGAGFASCPGDRACGNTVHVRARSGEVVLGDGSPFNLVQRAGEIVVQLPPGVGTGEAYVHVVVGGTLTNGVLVTLRPD